MPIFTKAIFALHWICLDSSFNASIKGSTAFSSFIKPNTSAAFSVSQTQPPLLKSETITSLILSKIRVALFRTYGFLSFKSGIKRFTALSSFILLKANLTLSWIRAFSLLPFLRTSIKASTALMSFTKPKARVAQYRTSESSFSSFKITIRGFTALASPILLRARAASLRTYTSSSFKTSIKASEAFLSPIKPKLCVALLRTCQFSLLNSPIKGSTAGAPIFTKARAALSRTSQSLSFNASTKGSTAPASLILPKASAEILRTRQFSLFNSPIKVSTARVPIFTRARAALSRTFQSSSSSCNTLVKGSTAGVPILTKASIASSRTTKSSSFRFLISFSIRLLCEHPMNGTNRGKITKIEITNSSFFFR